MADYKTMYLKLFNEVTSVIKKLQDFQVESVVNPNKSSSIEVSELTAIIESLQKIQAQTEEVYIKSDKQ
ncbi:MAG: hypothetical protein IJC83_05110 [Oscillospiraceae bacterium]|nr:hypothetical protein [Oscillospiraceae bacterium]